MFKIKNSEKRTRQRGKNFSPSEEDILLRLLKPYKPIIDNKKSDASSCQMKKDAWEQLAQEFTDQTGMPRTWRTLKDKYKNMNTKIKTEGRRWVDNSFNQNQDDFELSASSCVSVVYDEVGEEENNKFSTDNNEFPKEIKHEKIEKNPSQDEIHVELPRAYQYPSAPEEVSPETSNRSLDADRKEVLRLQQRFYQSENARSAKRHRLEVKNLQLKNQILELELEERRKRMELNQKITTITLS